MEITVVVLDSAGNELHRAVVSVGAPTAELAVEEESIGEVPPMETAAEEVPAPVEEVAVTEPEVESVSEEPASETVAPAAEESEAVSDEGAANQVAPTETEEETRE